MRPARRLSAFVVTGSLALNSAWLPAQTPVPDLITGLRSSATDSQRWDAALALGAATFADAAERDAARAALEEAVTSREAGLRVNAATALGKLGDPQSVDVLERALSDRNALVRQAAARALGRIGDENAARALLKALRDPNLTVRAQTIHALGETGQSVAVAGLEQTLLAKSDSPDAPLRAEAAKALEAMGSFGVSALVSGLGSDDPSVRFYAAQSLGSIGNPSAAAALVELFDDANPAVASQAASAVGRLGEPAIPQLLEQLDSDRANVRLNTTKALGVVGAPAVGPVRNLYNAATARIAELFDERAVAVAVSEAQRQPVVLPPTTPAEATTPPADTGEDAFGMPPLTDSEIRREAARLKSKMKSIKRRTQRAEELVRLRLREEGYNQRYDAAQAYLSGEEPPKTAVGAGNAGVQPFLVTIPEQEPKVDLPSTPTGEAGAPQTLPTTRPLRVIDREIERFSLQAQAAILALGSIGNDEAVTALSEVVRQGELDDATVAAEALGRTRNANAIPVLVNALGDAAFAVSVRANAATGLGRFDTDIAKNALEQAVANDPSATVRDAARSALDNLSVSVTP
jgi:HEAT repeat protein